MSMTDPRNVAHDKKVAHNKEAAGEEVAPGADETARPGRKPRMDHGASDETGDEGLDEQRSQTTEPTA